MVSNNSRPRPLWILKIHQRVSINKFKRHARKIAEEDDICYVLKAKDLKKKNVYQVTVETMENCGTPECEKIIWVPEGLAKATGEMFEKFEEEEDEQDPETTSIDTVSDTETSEDDEITEEIEKEYEEMRAAESFDPYAPDSEDEDDIENLLDFSGLDNETKETTI
ncbi:hypothetical protein CAEBREN_03447 [Caenorhabditis brenneri]|uniref:Uncharacterized protein n=1 Tax=Caenorhabditis brenneri TaxID=135651 RepID=G0MF85_CAEBE|nr:hypothetical protein CAEBREN_03447 [Caenorhabditis brenneri]